MGKKKNRSKKAAAASDNQSSPSTETSSQLSSDPKLEHMNEEFFDACSIATTVEEEAPLALAHDPVVAEEPVAVPVVEKEPFVKGELTIGSGPAGQSQEEHEVRIVEKEEETTNTVDEAPIESLVLEANGPSDDFDDFVEADQTTVTAPIVEGTRPALPRVESFEQLVALISKEHSTEIETVMSEGVPPLPATSLDTIRTQAREIFDRHAARKGQLREQMAHSAFFHKILKTQ